MDKFFYPKNIAVAGVSPDGDKNPNVILSNLMEMGFRGKIYGIGKQRGEISGIPVYISIEEVKKPVDLLVVMVPASEVPDLLRDAGRAGIKRAVVITAGFNELGGRGNSLAEEITSAAAEYNIRFIGPNCQGIICPESGVCVPFAPVNRKTVKKGGIALIAQSGSVGWSGSFILTREIDGISKIVSLGNKLNVTEVDMVAYLIEDPQTRIIALYLESFSDGRKLCELARKSTKPIIVFKSNISGKKSSLAFSHTAALASDNRIVNGALAQAGILQAQSFSELIKMCKAMSLERMRGKNLAVLAASGGMGIIGEDAVRKEGLELAELPESILQEIAEKGDWKIFNFTNPIDIGGFFNNAHLIDSINSILSLEGVDGAVFSAFSNGPYCYPFDSLQLTEQVERVSRKHSKPVAMNFVADLETIEQTKKEKGYPVFDTIEDAVRALSTLWEYRETLTRPHTPYQSLKQEKINAERILSAYTEAPDSSRDLLAFELVKAYGIPCEIPAMATDLEQALAKAEGMGYPVVMKINSPDISHKTDAGGVKTDIRNETELEIAFPEMLKTAKNHAPRARIYGVSLQKMISGGLELIIGGKYDKDFGPVVMFGMGGIFVEVLKDVAFRMAPLCREEAGEMIAQSKGVSLLKGLRGKKPYDISTLTDVLERFSLLLAHFPQIAEMDLNPVKIFHEGDGLTAVDARIMLTPGSD